MTLHTCDIAFLNVPVGNIPTAMHREVMYIQYLASRLHVVVLLYPPTAWRIQETPSVLINSFIAKKTISMSITEFLVPVSRRATIVSGRSANLHRFSLRLQSGARDRELLRHRQDLAEYHCWAVKGEGTAARPLEMRAVFAVSISGHEHLGNFAEST